MAENKILKLHDNIQFIYELALARLELQSLNVDFEITNNLREFKLNFVDKIDLLKKSLAYFKSINGEFTDYHFIQQHNQTSSVNQYLTHWFYPYKGKFHPQMIRALINIIGVNPGETILDPFIGSGTTALECQLLGINCVGIDISPLCALISRVKTESLGALPEIEEAKDNFLMSVRPENGNLFQQGSLFSEKKSGDIKNKKVSNFFKLGEMIAHSDESRRGRDFQTSFISNINKMLASLRDYKEVKSRLGLELGEVDIRQGDARNLSVINNKVHGIITSPPYSIALNYVANDAHALTALGHNLDKIKEEFIGVRGAGFNKFELYNQDMDKAYRQMYSILEKGRYCVIVIGNVTFQSQEIDTTAKVVEQCESAGFALVKKIEKIIFGLYNIMQKEYILIFKKP
ncbi:MAG: site-specific DNA-methyltransferase [Candidatus Omnitrophica bacterium]|nr:site-specific DNA-methyltransferase [Candidatus Omnitrophota bacterium]